MVSVETSLVELLSTMICLSESKCMRMGAVVHAALRMLKACSTLGDQANVQTLRLSWVSGLAKAENPNFHCQ